MRQIHLMNLQRSRRVPRRQVAALAARIVKHFRVARAEVSLVFVGPARMRALNRGYRDHDRTTDVLAFDLRLPTQRRPRVLVGEVVVLPQMAKMVAHRYGQSYTEELLTYVAHGLLHLLGYRDGTRAEQQRMERLQHMFVHGC